MNSQPVTGRHQGLGYWLAVWGIAAGLSLAIEFISWHFIPMSAASAVGNWVFIFAVTIGVLYSDSRSNKWHLVPKVFVAGAVATTYGLLVWLVRTLEGR